MGADLDVGSDPPTARLPKKKAVQYKTNIRNAIATNSLHRGVVAKRRGEMNWASDFTFGRWGRAIMCALKVREKYVKGSRLNASLVAALNAAMLYEMTWRARRSRPARARRCT